jgi:WD40 repeat protein
LPEQSGAATGFPEAPLVFSPSGEALVFATPSLEVVFWDPYRRRELQKIKTGPGTLGRLPFALSADGKTLATFAGGDVPLWDVTSGVQVRIVPVSARPILRGAFSPDGKMLATCGSEGSVSIYGLTTGQTLTADARHAGEINALTYAQDGKSLLTGGTDQTVKVWDATGHLRMTLTGHTGSVRHVAVSPDGTTIASASEDGTVRIWSLATGDELLVFDLMRTAGWVGFTPDGQSLLASRNTPDRRTQVCKFSIK